MKYGRKDSKDGNEPFAENSLFTVRLITFRTIHSHLHLSVLYICFRFFETEVHLFFGRIILISTFKSIHSIAGERTVILPVESTVLVYIVKMDSIRNGIHSARQCFVGQIRILHMYGSFQAFRVCCRYVQRSITPFTSILRIRFALI